MGMSASQARLLSLQARQSNLEYQGQQINQERTILSQQATALYNSLLAMNVPTPPSTQDFTTVEYSGTLGTTTYTFDASSVKPGSDGGYNVTLGYTDYGHSLTRNNGYATTSNGYETIKNGQKFEASETESGEVTKTVSGFQYSNNIDSSAEAPADGTLFFKQVSTKPSSGVYYVLDESGTYLVEGGKGNVDNEDNNVTTYFVPCYNAEEWDSNTCIKLTDSERKTDINVTVDTSPSVTVTQDDLANLYVMDSDGVISKATANENYYVDSSGAVHLLGNGTFFLDNGKGSDTAKKGTSNGYTIAGYEAMTMAEYKNQFDEKTMDTYNGYLEAIENSGLKKADGSAYTADDFMVYVDDNGQPHFALETDVKDNNTCVTYDYLANGSYTKNQEYENAKLTFDPATGRITSIDIPSEEKDENGNPVSWSTIKVEAATVTDELAYQDAYNDYEYQQYQYDKKQQEINAQTSIIQAEDRNLELKLQRLDNERTQITTEIEAVEKVINDNIEASYKTFSG